MVRFYPWHPSASVCTRGQSRQGPWALLAIAAALATTASAGDFPAFREVVVDPHCGEICYALTLADVDGDGREDIVAVTENRVLWYQAPEWKRRVIIEDQTVRDNVCIAAHDIDGDGHVDFALGAGWTKVGTIQWLSRGRSLDEKWNVHLIGEEPWLHRMRFADVLGTGRAQLVISPLNAVDRDGVRLTAFEIPADPKTERWPATVMDDSFNRLHNHWHDQWYESGPVLTLAASQEGVHVIAREAGGGWRKDRIGTGAAGDKPADRGAGEIKTGRLGRDARRFVTTIEPMHGTSVVVYLADSSAGGWQRHVLDDTLRRGHALWTADLDGDGMDEIIVGHSDAGPGPVKGPGVYVFDAADATGREWTKHVIDDGGMATEDAIAADLTGDGRIDIVAGGRNTHNVKLYVNEGLR
ncbi:MAG TPA: VCBS repeat-containing protein [Planctomycetaceae bacterium]|nr:VCBS repeat-containing protein [Planctomycetaceae bacterium]